MSSKVKLWINMLAIVLVFAIIVVSVGALLSKESLFLEIPGTKQESANLNMEINGKVNGNDFFTISFVEGKKTQSIDTIDPEEMRFTTQRPVINFDMAFENNSTSILWIKISGIYLDSTKFPSNPRFTTTTFINETPRLMTYEADGTGTIILELNPASNEDLTPNIDDASLINFSIKYELNTYNRNINDEKQDLLITLSTERFDLE